jgi:hypothetical protein
MISQKLLLWTIFLIRVLEVGEIALRSKSIHQGFRIDEDVLAGIKKEALKRELSLNKLINKILKDWVSRDMYFSELGFIPTSKESIRIWLEKLEEKDIIEDAKEFGRTRAQDYVMYFFGEVTIHTLLQFLEILFSRFPAYQHKINNNNHCFTVNHDVSRNYTIFFGVLLKALIEPIINNPVKIGNPTSNMLNISFEIDHA